jgi:hypothetical protein
MATSLSTARFADEAKKLITFLHENPIACPANCLNYQSSSRARLARLFSKGTKGLVGVGKWLDRQPWQVKLGLIGLVVVVLIPQWVPRIIELLKAFNGK